MMKRSYSLAWVLGLLFESGSDAQYPALGAFANKVIQTKRRPASSCGLRRAPKSPQEQEAIQLLRYDPARRAAFIDKVAAPIANKMFECGMIRERRGLGLRLRSFRRVVDEPRQVT